MTYGGQLKYFKILLITVARSLPFFKRVLNSAIQPFEIKSQEHNIANAKFF